VEGQTSERRVTAMTLADLQRRALEMMKLADFGPEAVRVNQAIVDQAPNDAAAWTRLGRCHLEQRNFDEAVLALRTALARNPASGVATNLLNEVRKRRALTPTAGERAITGFSTREFALLESLPADEACRALRPRIDALFDTINASSVAARIVEARQRRGESGTKLFHANSCAIGSAGHIFAFHHGGRWEPQFNLAWYSPPAGDSCFRVGLGFHLSRVDRSPDRTAGQERVLAFFERFQQIVERSWRRELARWMAANGGFIQYGGRPPATDLLPDRAIEWLVNCHNLPELEWVFIGRWLFLDKPADAKILSERAKLATVVEDTFRSFHPIWLTTYAGED
jgi:tetratricopeptide (TPR) repeat protein